MIFQVIYTWPDGREEVRYEREAGSYSAAALKFEVEALQATGREQGYVSPYSWREKEEGGAK